MYTTIPKDPVMLLSFVNLKLRDECSSLDIFCERYDIEVDMLCKKLAAIDYHYIEKENQFR